MNTTTSSSSAHVVLTTQLTASLDQNQDAWMDRLVVQRDPVTGAVEGWRIDCGNRFSVTSSKLVDRGESGVKVYGWRGNRWRRLSSRAAASVLKSLA